MKFKNNVVLVFCFLNFVKSLVAVSANFTTFIGPHLMSSAANATATDSLVVTAGAVFNGGTGLTTIPAFNLVVGNGILPLNLLAPNSASGISLISQGSSANPTYGTVVVAGGGTGLTTLTNHGVLLGQATSPVVSPSLGSAGALFLSGGSSADPSFVVPTTTGSGLTLTTNATTLDYSLVTPVSVSTQASNTPSQFSRYTPYAAAAAGIIALYLLMTHAPPLATNPDLQRKIDKAQITAPSPGYESTHGNILRLDRGESFEDLARRAGITENERGRWIAALERRNGLQATPQNDPYTRTGGELQGNLQEPKQDRLIDLPHEFFSRGARQIALIAPSRW